LQGAPRSSPSVCAPWCIPCTTPLLPSTLGFCGSRVICAAPPSGAARAVARTPRPVARNEGPLARKRASRRHRTGLDLGGVVWGRLMRYCVAPLWSVLGSGGAGAPVPLRLLGTSGLIHYHPWSETPRSYPRTTTHFKPANTRPRTRTPARRASEPQTS